MRSIILLSNLVCLTVGAADHPSPAADTASETSPLAIRAAIRKAIPLLENGARESARQRQCFTCHNQAVPVLTLAEARRRGFRIDEKNFEAQLKHTVAHLKRGQKNYVKGRGQGGKVLTAGYALWTLAAAGHKSDETTAAVSTFLLGYQKNASHWSHRGKRPPSSGSDFTATYVALRGLADYGTENQQLQISTRHRAIASWLAAENPTDTEDRVFRLLSLHLINADEAALRHAADALKSDQREDGGWAQMAELSSDAYATGTALTALLRTESSASDDPVVQSGISYLLSSQLPDGSWHVTTRAEPFQEYYESGFLHDEDQFISITASGWSTLALLLSLPESPTTKIDPN